MGVIIGIDIGSSMIRGVFGEDVNGKKIKVLAVAERECEEEMIVDGEIEIVTNVKEVIDEILTELQAKVAKLNLNSVPSIDAININIGGKNIKRELKSHVMNFNVGKVMTDEDVNIIYKDFCRINHHSEAVDEIIHLVPADFSIANRKIKNDPKGREASGPIKLDATIFTVNKSYLTKIRQTIDSIIAKSNVYKSLEIDKLIFSGFAPAAAVLDNDKKKYGVMLVDIGDQITNISIFHEGRLRYQKQLFLAGGSITNDLSQAFRIKKEFATTIKHEHISLDIATINPNDYIKIGSDERTAKKISILNASLVVEARLVELITMIDAEISLSGVDKSEIIDGIILTGGTSNIDGIVNLFHSITGLETNFGNVDEYIESKLPETDRLEYATAIGLALWDIRSFDVFDRQKHAPPIQVYIEPKVIEPEEPIKEPKTNIFTSTKSIFSKIFKSVEGDEFDDK